MQAVSRIPTPALIHGWLGVLPFAGLALAAITGAFLSRDAALGALTLYGIVILSFMGGAQWGLAMLPARDLHEAMQTRLAVSVLPALAAFGMWFLPVVLALPGLAALFVALLAYDITTVRAGAAPAWYGALRMQLTGAVVACLVVAALLGRP